MVPQESAGLLQQQHEEHRRLFQLQQLLSTGGGGSSLPSCSSTLTGTTTTYSSSMSSPSSSHFPAQTNNGMSQDFINQVVSIVVGELSKYFASYSLSTPSVYSPATASNLPPPTSGHTTQPPGIPASLSPNLFPNVQQSPVILSPGAQGRAQIDLVQHR